MVDSVQARRERIVVLLENAKLPSRCRGTVPLQNKRPGGNGVYDVEPPEFDEFAWFVGLFEGEGSIYLHRPRKDKHHEYPMVEMKMTDHDTLLRAREAIGIGNVTGPYAQKKANCKPYWRWTASANQGHTIIRRLLPHLCERRRAKAIEILTRTGYMQPEEQMELQ